MATLNMRYGGQLISIPEGENFNANYGTAKLNIKVNSTSTMKFGLTTNTNAQEYCKLRLRVGGKNAYIGRVSTSSVAYSRVYTGDIINNSTVTSARGSGYNETWVETSSARVIRTSTCRSSTGSTEYLVSSTSYTSTINPGSGNGTSAADPTIRTVTNNTGSSVTSRTASANVASLTYYSFSVQESVDYYRSTSESIKYGWPALGANKTRSYTSYWTYKASNRISNASYRGSNYNSITKERNSYTKTSSYEISPDDWVTRNTVSTTRRIVSTSKSGTLASNVTTGEVYSIKSNTAFNPGISDYDWAASAITRTNQNSYSRNYTQNGSIVSYSKTTYSASRTRGGYNSYGQTQAPEAIQTLYQSSKRWSYWWVSSEIATFEYYSYDEIYYTSYTRTHLTVSFTMHNMNI